MNFGKPDETLALANYVRLVDSYDASCERIAPIRAQAVALLGSRHGDRVLDVACGTGTSFPLLYTGVGPGGRVVGVELSPQMCRRARDRAGTIDSECVQVIESHAQRADFGATRFDAVLFHYTHDVLRDPAALAHVFAAVKPGARVAVAGLKAGPSGRRRSDCNRSLGRANISRPSRGSRNRGATCFATSRTFAGAA